SVLFAKWLWQVLLVDGHSSLDTHIRQDIGADALPIQSENYVLSQPDPSSASRKPATTSA
ncbi:MAG: hypothetical protein ACKPKO_06810, partial [Candidatus Fonsibacter sp.]